jgi:site-specific recombinase XerC
VQGRKGWVRLREKGSKQTSLPSHHRLDEMLEEYIDKAGLASEPKALLFRTAAPKSGNTFTASSAAASAGSHPASCVLSDGGTVFLADLGK